MKNSFWMFFILLLIITIISSLGGGIRYRENFLEEVFDINDALDSVAQEFSDFPKYFSPLLNKQISEEQIEKPKQHVVEKQIVSSEVAKPILKEADMPSVLNIQPPPRKTVAFDESATQVIQPMEPKGNFNTLIEGFSGEMYAMPF